MSSFTPGPWCPGTDEDGHIVYGPDSTLIADVFDDRGDMATQAANACLIAAAPSMLDRLEQCLAALEKWHEIAKHEQNLLSLIKKTISEAKGEKP